MMQHIVSQLELKVLAGSKITFEEAVMLAAYPKKELLYAAADRIRAHFCGNKMDLCTIVNAKSGKCSEDCKWCSQSAHHATDVAVYEKISTEDALMHARNNSNAGAHKFSLVTSGRQLSDIQIESFSCIYKSIKSATPDIELCASMGLLNTSKLQKLKDSGVKNYHCNIETAPSYFSKVCTTHTIEEKLDTLRAARSLGMGLCSGGIIGMGETMEQRIEMALLLSDLEIESIPVNILNPIEGTPLQNQSTLSDEDILTTIALFRFCNPKAQIRFAGGRSQIIHIQDQALHAGINAALIGDLLTTTGGRKMEQDIADFRKAGFDTH